MNYILGLVYRAVPPATDYKSYNESLQEKITNIENSLENSEFKLDDLVLGDLKLSNTVKDYFYTQQEYIKLLKNCQEYKQKLELFNKDLVGDDTFENIVCENMGVNDNLDGYCEQLIELEELRNSYINSLTHQNQ